MNDKLAKPGDDAGVKEEIKTALQDAMKRLLKLLENGASVNVYLPSEVTSDEPEIVEEIEKSEESTAHIAAARRDIEIKQSELRELTSGADETDETEQQPPNPEPEATA